MREQIAQHGTPRRASATAEELATRRTTYSVANKHRTGHYSGLHPEDQPYLSGEIEDDDRLYNTRRPTSTRRYNVDVEGRVIQQGQRRIIIHDTLPPRRSQKEPEYEARPVSPRRRAHWSVFIGLAMLVMLTGWVAVTAFSNWWQITQDDWHYGRPRTYQVDAIVGHHDSASHPSHFIATNLKGKISIIEISGGDTSHSVIYVGPTLLGQGQDLTPVTVSFSDVNEDGKPDMILHVLSQDIIYLNDGTKFVLQKTP